MRDQTILSSVPNSRRTLTMCQKTFTSSVGVSFWYIGQVSQGEMSLIVISNNVKQGLN